MTLAHARQLIAARDYAQAREVLLPLAAAAPHDAEIQYETACVHDSLGFEAEAVPFYRAALAGKLAPDARRGAFTGLGSTYRTLGRFAEARDTLEQGLAEFPRCKRDARVPRDGRPQPRPVAEGRRDAALAARQDNERPRDRRLPPRDRVLRAGCGPDVAKRGGGVGVAATAPRAPAVMAAMATTSNASERQATNRAAGDPVKGSHPLGLHSWLRGSACALGRRRFTGEVLLDRQSQPAPRPLPLSNTREQFARDLVLQAAHLAATRRNQVVRDPIDDEERVDRELNELFGGREPAEDRKQLEARNPSGSGLRLTQGVGFRLPGLPHARALLDSLAAQVGLVPRPFRAHIRIMPGHAPHARAGGGSVEFLLEAKPSAVQRHEHGHVEENRANRVVVTVLVRESAQALEDGVDGSLASAL